MATLSVPTPDLIRVQRGPRGAWRSPSEAAALVDLRPDGGGLAVNVSVATGVVLSRVHLRWRRPVPSDALVLGDEWERTYGDTCWQPLRAEAVHPWMVLIHSPSAATTWGAGVDVRAGSFAFWTVDDAGVSLWLDLRAGSDPVELGDRELTAAVVRFVDGGPAFATQGELASALCRDPRPSGPLVGANNWYYAYGRGFDADAVVRDARTVAELVGDHPVRPFGVVDDGWSLDGTADGLPASGGPWDVGRAIEFPDMAEVAARIAAEGVRPGIWFRPLQHRWQPEAGGLRPWEGGWALDPSHPATLERVADDVRRIRAWGFELIKHDFSTFEALGQWGPTMGPRPIADGVHVHDRTRTTAEVLVDFYRAIREAGGDGGVVLGCNVVGHLAAGLVEAQRTGDDTSGLVWERTRRVGVNTLAFRAAQHGRFFTVDADCVPSTPGTDWGKNRQFLDLIARSGTALFVSVDPVTRTDAVEADLSAALRLALDGGAPGGVEPLDWLHTSTPSLWRSGSETVRYEWMADEGSDPFDATGDAAPPAAEDTAG
ncbi:alpha-amylase family protein [Tessaracoccus sp. Y1736]